MSDRKADLRGLAELMAKALTEAPDQAQVDIDEEQGDVLLELSVAENDMGRVIGKSGRTARALRQIVSAAGAKEGKHVELDILD